PPPPLFPYTTLFRSSPRMERPPAELGGMDEHVDLVGAARHDFLEPGLAGLGFAYAVSCGDRVGAQEHPIETAPFQCGFGCGPQEDRKSTRLNSSHVS